ncbi:M48 family metallopeptidase [Gilvimarinus algae]|uniref:M48 family metallopeptidase n=1 Tax=Gilvimarinus algae TaxID=3058037 RepID=A0ABT8TCR0_9GAMM|nr:M48 family metallopeptidase [Gilvimarinus sp. SDUM040014]MDO3381726.1 M48 family metallopeptidase [Gilvimarinus sp. SDUM040014]
MGYQNRQPPEHINAQTEPWVGDLLKRLALVLGVIALSMLLLLYALTELARFSPFVWERRLANGWTEAEQPDNEKADELQRLADQLARAGGLDPALSVTLHYNADDTVNAFATLGGHLLIFQGLLDALESEQALAFVLAHEIAHVQRRHPIQSAARQLGLSLSLALVFGQSDLTTLAGTGGSLALLNYSRHFEQDADAWAYRAVYRHYGHLNGSAELFEQLASSEELAPAWMATHPHAQDRLAAREALASENGWPLTGELAPMPAILKQP